MYIFSVVVFIWQTETLDSTQAMRDIGQRYHRYMTEHVQDKANIMHVVEQDIMS